jgi:hypothetical protein
MDQQLFSAIDSNSPNSRHDLFDIPVASPWKKNERHNGSDGSRRASKVAEFTSSNLAPKPERSAESARPEDPEENGVAGSCDETVGYKDELVDFTDLVDAAAESTEDEYLPDESTESSESSDSESPGFGKRGKVTLRA